MTPSRQASGESKAALGGGGGDAEKSRTGLSPLSPVWFLTVTPLHWDTLGEMLRMSGAVASE